MSVMQSTNLSPEVEHELGTVLATIASCPRHRAHHYMIESTTGLRYAGADAREALNALLGIDEDREEEGYAVAEAKPAEDDDQYGVWPNCFRAAERIELAAIRVSNPEWYGDRFPAGTR